MTCNEVRLLLEAHVDGELDLAHRLMIEAHLQECPSCHALAAGFESRRSVLRESLPRAAAPDVLLQRIRASLPRAGSAATPSSANRLPIKSPWKARSAWVAALAASVMFAAAAGYRAGWTRRGSEKLVAQAVQNHVRSLLAQHLTDVASTDQHTVKPWFAGRLPFSPTVIDLAARGFPLIGGRLERVDDQPAAALVYQHGPHRINLLIWPATPGQTWPAMASIDGYHVAGWTYSGFNYAAVSDLQENELAQFAEFFRGQLSR